MALEATGMAVNPAPLRNKPGRIKPAGHSLVQTVRQPRPREEHPPAAPFRTHGVNMIGLPNWFHSPMQPSTCQKTKGRFIPAAGRLFSLNPPF